ncbi:MAG: hypothetical protein QOJ15_7192, partial [Bradyrhizobium sp.]|nr:hypothetical protein [Bradyrhizobium sp.]
HLVRALKILHKLEANSKLTASQKKWIEVMAEMLARLPQ